MAVVSLGTLTDLEKVSYIQEGLPVAKPKLIYSQYAVKDRVAKREGKTRQWFRFTKFGLTSQAGDFSSDTYGYVTNTTGAAPTFTPHTPATTTVSAAVNFLFGQGNEWNEGVEYTSFADIPKELRNLNMLQAAEAIDTEVRNVVLAGSNVIYANKEATRPALLSTDIVDLYDFFTAVTTLRNNDAPDIKGMYSALCSANVIEELFRDSVFQTAIQFQKNYMFDATIAEIFGIRFDFSSRAGTTSNGGSASQIATIDQTIVTGDNAYGTTAWMLNDYDLVYTPPGGHSDAWAVRNLLTWKFMHKAVILNQNWVCRLESSRRA
jgi:N4-gp56 family major capsid protein